MITSDLMVDTGSYVDKYPQFVEAVDFQKQDLFWSHHEIDLNKDKHDLRKKLNDAQRHAITFNQRLLLTIQKKCRHLPKSIVIIQI